jgi:hypothetical protein
MGSLWLLNKKEYSQESEREELSEQIKINKQFMPAHTKQKHHLSFRALREIVREIFEKKICLKF